MIDSNGLAGASLNSHRPIPNSQPASKTGPFGDWELEVGSWKFGVIAACQPRPAWRLESVPRSLSVHPVQRTLPAVVIEIVRRQPTTPEKVDFAWRTAVGPAIARATTVSLDGEGTLLIRASSLHWQHEIQQSLSLVRARLDSLLGDALVRVAFTTP
jgi:hypothetical protein